MSKKHLLLLTIITYGVLQLFITPNMRISLHKYLFPTFAQVSTSNTSNKIEYDIGKKNLKVYIKNKLSFSFDAISGAPTTPTPEGAWYIKPNDVSSKKITFTTSWGKYNIVPYSQYTFKYNLLNTMPTSNCTDGTIVLKDSDFQDLYEHSRMVLSCFVIINTKPIFRELKLGDMGSDVLCLQLALKQRGYSIDNANGYYGEQTKNAIKQFQQKNTLYPTGKVNINTFLKIIRFS